MWSDFNSLTRVKITIFWELFSWTYLLLLESNSGVTLMESFWRSWDNSLSDSLLYYCIFYAATRGTSYFEGKA